MIFSKKKPDINDKTDEELLLLYRETGDTECFGVLYNRYTALVYGVCLKYLQHEVKAQDASMEIFEKLFYKISDYEITVFRTWLYSVVKNHCFQRLRTNQRTLTVDYDSAFMESDIVMNLLNEEGQNDKREILLKKCLENLPEPQRIAITHFFYDEKSYLDIVELTGFHLKSIKSYIQNGKRNLKICIEKQENGIN